MSEARPSLHLPSQIRPPPCLGSRASKRYKVVSKGPVRTASPTSSTVIEVDEGTEVVEATKTTAPEVKATEVVAAPSEVPWEALKSEPAKASTAPRAEERDPWRMRVVEEDRIAFRQKVEEILTWASWQMFAGEFFSLLEAASMDNTLGRIGTLLLSSPLAC